MKRMAYPLTHSIRLVVVMAAFLTIIFSTSVNLTFAASGEKSPGTAPRVSAVDRLEEHIKNLQGSLQITKAQEELWNTLTQVMRDNAKAMDALTKARAENAKTMNALEDLKSYGQITEAHSEGLKKYIPAFEALYASMSDEQKKNADILFRTGRHGKSKRR
jgi:hypothetical protein